MYFGGSVGRSKILPWLQVSGNDGISVWSKYKGRRLFHEMVKRLAAKNLFWLQRRKAVSAADRQSAQPPAANLDNPN